jgi:Reverse transcriptase (RNA-dependent DNA polymerase)
MAKFDEFVNVQISEKIRNKNLSERRTLTPVNRAYSVFKYKTEKLRKNVAEIIKTSAENSTPLLTGIGPKRGSPFKNLSIEQRKTISALNSDIRRADAKRRTMPYRFMPKNIIRYSYVRYADDWVLLTNASESFMEEIRKDCETFFLSNLKLTLSPEKTKITNTLRDTFQFLGFTLGHHAEHKRILFVSKVKRTTINPLDRTQKRLGINRKMIILKRRSHF